MKVYFNGFWDGFLEKTNPVHCQFFLELFEKIWKEPIELGDKDSSEILCESIFGTPLVTSKPWKYSILFSGESRLQKNSIDHLYTFVLYGQRNNGNRINCPLFVPYLYCNNYLERLEISLIQERKSAQNAVVAILSNPNGLVRNTFLEELEKHVPVCYAGGYKNNMGNTFAPAYNTPEFQAFVSNFKCVVTMENSEEDTYITEKICHGFLAQTVPIYWGSPRVADYFNQERFIHLKNTSEIQDVIKKVKSLLENEEEWKATIKKPVFQGGKLWRTIDIIARDCRKLLTTHVLKPVDHIYFICKEEFEPVRYKRLELIINSLSIPEDAYSFLCPTYKHTITDEKYATYVKTPFKELIPWCDRKLYKAELSLTLNYRAVLEDINKQYKDGIFLILESDIVYKENIYNITNCMNTVYPLRKQWDCIHIGHGSEEQFWKTSFPETLTKKDDSIRLSRHLNTRCTDSMLWSKEGVEKMLYHMTHPEDYSEPLDHYISRYFETHQDIFKYYWSDPTYFIQMTMYGGEKSRIRD